jgi:hypothetical protein
LGKALTGLAEFSVKLGAFCKIVYNDEKAGLSEFLCRLHRARYLQVNSGICLSNIIAK